MAAKIIWLSLIVCSKICLSVGERVNVTVPPFSDEDKIVLNSSITTSGTKWILNAQEGQIAACKQVASDVVDSYYVMKYISTAPAEEITITVGYQLKCCASGIRWDFSIGLYVLMSSMPLSPFPDPNTSPYMYVGELRNTSVMHGNTLVDFTSQKIVSMRNFRGIYIGFRDRGICGNIHSVTMHYYKCPKVGGEQMVFPATAAPNSSTAVLRIGGNCIARSETDKADDNFMLCYTNGTAKFYGRCYCLAGYQSLSMSQCIECPPKTFKDTKGNFPCKVCGKNVLDGKLPRTAVCKCISGFYRPTAKKNVYDVDCEEPPTEPRLLNATSIGSTWAFISWVQPSNNGTGDQVKYEISYNGGTNTTGNLYFNVTGLKTFTYYTITVSSINNVTKAISRNNGSTISFKTFSGLPSKVRNLIIKRNADLSVTVSWQEPEAKGGSDLDYAFVVNGGKRQYTNSLNYTVYQKQNDVTYTISVKARTSAGFSPEETITFTIIGKAEGIPLTLGIAVGVSLFVIVIIAIILVIVFYKRRHPKHLQPVRLENGEVILPSRSSGARVYIDPTTYNDVEDAVEEFANELEKNWIELSKLIGGGEFGDVYKGTLRKPGENERIVAVKTLKSNANKKAKDDFLGEAAYMGQFDDPNVISIEGVVVKSRPVMIVIEFMSNGSLDSFLQDNDGKLSSLQMLGMARGVSSGMTYLSEMMFIHRDLAARNVLVNDYMVCKVADFGMSRELQHEEETYNTTGGKIPVRWTAPEAIQYKKFTVASDVWSYGVLLWEIMSYGERPYWDWGNYEVLERLASGYRLPPPMNCPKIVHDLMLSCWRKDRVKRPKFHEIRDTIDKWIRSPELLKMEGSVVTKRDENLDYASMKTLKEWLDSIGLGHYMEKFSDRGLVTPRQILELSDGDLKDIGIVSVGHRNKIMKSINTTKGQLIRTKSLAI